MGGINYESRISESRCSSFSRGDFYPPSPLLAPRRSFSLHAAYAGTRTRVHIYTRTHTRHTCQLPFPWPPPRSSPPPPFPCGLVDRQKMVTHRILGVLSLCHAASAPPSHPGFRGGLRHGSRILHPAATPDGCNGTTHIRSRPAAQTPTSPKLCDARTKQRVGECRKRERERGNPSIAPTFRAGASFPVVAGCTDPPYRS